MDSFISWPHPLGALAPGSATQSPSSVPGPHHLPIRSACRCPAPPRRRLPPADHPARCLGLGAASEQGPHRIAGERSCLEAARVDAPKPGLRRIRGQQPRGQQPRALRLGWRITARSESGSLPPVLFLGLIGLVRCPCRTLTSDPGPSAAATASQNQGLDGRQESLMRPQLGKLGWISELSPMFGSWPCSPGGLSPASCLSSTSLLLCLCPPPASANPTS